MDIDEVKARKDQLEKNIRNQIESFISETGCYPELSLNWFPITAIGGPTRWIPEVKTRIFL